MIEEMGKRAQAVKVLLRRATSEQKNRFLLTLAELLRTESGEILSANSKDVEQAQRAGLSEAMIDRLTLNPKRLEAIASDLEVVAALPDPIGERFDETTLSNGLQVYKQRVPIGVLAVIYEARPNVTIDVAAVAVKTGNAILLRGGSETLRSNQALVEAVCRALELNELPREAVQFINDPDRQRVAELLRMYETIDMLIPRGGAALHQYCRENSRIPVITGGIGICHLYVDEGADLAAAVPVIYNAKVQRPTVCNALDTVLVHRNSAGAFLPGLLSSLRAAGVTFRVDASALPYLGLGPGDASIGKAGLPEDIRLAGSEDFDTEWLSLVLGIKIVDSLEEAMEHIRLHSTGHSDGILTRNETHSQRFLAEVDSAAVYVNASTRFTDGGQLGLGTEVAISTQRLHARGPMGLRELTSYKWVIIGQNHVRA